MEDIIIIGAGPIGLYGATLCSLHKLKGLIIESLNQVGGQLTSLYPEKDIIDLPGYEKIKAKDFIEKLYNQYEKQDNKLELLLNETVINIEKEENYYKITTNKNSYQTKCVVITTGMGVFSPRPIGLANEKDFENIMYSCDDISQYKNKDVVVLGGGDSAIDFSLLIQPISKSTTIIHRRNDFRGQESSVDKMKEIGVNILTNYTILSLDKDNDKINITIKHNEKENTQVISTDYILVQYGQMPSKDNFEVEKISNLIKVSSFYQTSLENVFACGNIAYYEGKVKNIATGLGEISVIITKIDQIINPNKNIPIHF
jgi:thioredoxin reductase (NADPH)